MARGFFSTMNNIARQAERAGRARAQLQASQIRAVQRAERAQARAEVAEAKEQKRLYLESRMAEVEDLNRDLEESVDELKKLLVGSLGISSAINFDEFKVQPKLPIFNLGSLDVAIPMPQWSQYEPRKPLGFLLWFRSFKAKYRDRLEKGRRAFEDAKAHAAQR